MLCIRISPAQIIVPAPGTIYTIAGNGAENFCCDGSPATSAEMDHPTGVAVDTAGNVFIADILNDRIRKVAASTGIITTVAGNSSVGYFGGDGGAATQAALKSPWRVAVDTAGNLFIADTGNYRIRKVTASTGIISTVVGTGSTYSGGDGGLAINASLSNPIGVIVDGSNNLYIIDGNSIRKVTASTGVITKVAGSGTAGFSGDGGPATSAMLYGPNGIAIDASSNLYIADRNNNRIRKVDASTGIINTIVGTGAATDSGDGGPGTGSALNGPTDVAIDQAGNLYVSSVTRIREISSSTGIIRTIAGNGTTGYSGDGGAAINAEFNEPSGLAIDPAGTIFIADWGNFRVRAVGAPITPTVGVSCSPNPISYGGSNSVCTISVSGGATGTVSLTYNGTNWATLPLSSGSTTATWSSTFGIGTYTIAATYNGDATHNPATGSTSLVVNKATPTIGVSCSPNPIVYGGSNSVCTATVGGSATGSVLWTYNGINWATLPLSSGSTSATWSSTFGVGSYTIGASYSGDSNYNSVSASTILAVNQSSTATLIWSSANASQFGNATSVFAQPIGLSPTGSVGFYDGSTNIGSVQTGSISTTNLLPHSTGSSGWAVGGAGSFATTSDPAPDNSTTAFAFNYTGSTDTFALQAVSSPSLSSAYTFSVWLRVPSGTLSTNVFLTNQNGTPRAKAPATLTTTWQRFFVTGILNAADTALRVNIGGFSSLGQGTPGQIEVWGSQLEQGAVYPGPYVATSGASATASAPVAAFDISGLSVGTHSLTARYGGNSGDSTSTSATFAQQVVAAGTVTSVTASVNPTYFGQNLVLSALVGTGGAQPSGAVTFYSDGISIGNGNLTTLNATNLVPYSQQIGNSSWNGYCSATTASVNTASLTAPDGSYTATKITTPNWSGTYVCGQGGVGFLTGIAGGLQNGTQYTVSVWLRGASGGEQVIFGINDAYCTSVTLTTTWQRYTYTVTYSTDGESDRGFQVLDNTQPNANFYVWGAQVEKASAAGPYIETMTAPRTASAGNATLTTSALPVGTHSITASYAGNSQTLGSSSTAIAETVTPPKPSITSVSPASAPVGATVTITGPNFGATQGTSTVTFNGVVATPISWSITSVVVAVPKGATTGNIVVTVNGVSSDGTGFTVQPTPTPAITSLSPTSGPVNTQITITGTNLGTQNVGTVTIGGITATPISWSATQIIITVPSTLAVGSNNVIVTENGVASNAKPFVVIPHIAALSLTQGPVQMGFVITGTSFGGTQGTSTVTLNGVTAPVVAGSWGSNSITVQVPTGATTGNVVVTVSGQASNGVTFTVVSPFGCN